MSNDTHTATITEFLLSRIAEDEAVAEQVSNWDSHLAHELDGFSANAQRFARHVTPARVLAQCKATRAIVESHASFKADAGNVERSALDRLVSGGAAAGADTILSALAAVYVGHEDYRDEWSL